VTDEYIHIVLGRQERACAADKCTRPRIDKEVATVFCADGGVLTQHGFVCVRVDARRTGDGRRKAGLERPVRRATGDAELVLVDVALRRAYFEWILCRSRILRSPCEQSDKRKEILAAARVVDENVFLVD
jgi:hypothetical protein